MLTRGRLERVRERGQATASTIASPAFLASPCYYCCTAIYRAMRFRLLGDTRFYGTRPKISRGIGLARIKHPQERLPTPAGLSFRNNRLQLNAAGYLRCRGLV